MSNPSRNKGTAAETALVRWWRVNGYPFADRQPLRGRDQGDITLCPGVIVEVKDHKRFAGGIPAATLTEWLRQTELERDNARADLGILVVKRAGTTDPARWHAFVRLDVLARLLADAAAGDLSAAAHPDSGPVRLDVATLTRVLRIAGWGDRLEATA